MVSFFTAGSLEKDTIFGAARKFFDPSYFVMALGKVVCFCRSEFLLNVLNYLLKGLYPMYIL